MQIKEYHAFTDHGATMLMLIPEGAAEYATDRVRPNTPCLLMVSVGPVNADSSNGDVR